MSGWIPQTAIAGANGTHLVKHEVKCDVANGQ